MRECKTGEGAYGNVYACTHIETGAERAVKVIPKSLDQEQNDMVIREFNVIKELDHPNVLKSYALFENDTHFNIVTDLIRGGELYDLLESQFTEDEVRSLMKSMLSCINYCHKQNVVHRDLKPENVLLEENQDFKTAKIIDFGLARFFSAEEKTTFTNAVGSSYYMSPQVIEGNYTQKCDIWSCGIIAFVCMGGYAPFEGEDEMETAEQILDSEKNGIEFDDPSWDEFSDEALDFIRDVLAYDEKDRPSAAEALQHPWFDMEPRLSMEDASEMRESARTSIEKLRSFNSHDSKLKQCTYSLIASQILRKEEKEEVDEMFSALDVDCDGKISEEDMKAVYKEHYDLELSEDDLSGIMYEVNLSGSGSITYSEFVIASMLEKGLVSEHNLELAFHMLDKKQTGFLTLENLKEILDVNDDMEDYVKTRIIAPADLDGDGKISLGEFKILFSDAASVPEPVQTGRRGMMGDARQLSRKNLCLGRRPSIQQQINKRDSGRMSFRASVILDNPGDFLDDEFGNSDALVSSEPTFGSLLNIFESKKDQSNDSILQIPR